MKMFLMLFPHHMVQQNWLHEYRAMFEMVGAKYDRVRTEWEMPDGSRVCLRILQTPQDVQRLRGAVYCGFAREGYIDYALTEQITPMLRD